MLPPQLSAIAFTAFATATCNLCRQLLLASITAIFIMAIIFLSVYVADTGIAIASTATASSPQKKMPALAQDCKQYYLHNSDHTQLEGKP